MNRVKAGSCARNNDVPATLLYAFVPPPEEFVLKIN